MVLEVKYEYLCSSICCPIGQSPSDPDVSVIDGGDRHTSWSGWRDCKTKKKGSSYSYHIIKSVISE